MADPETQPTTVTAVRSPNAEIITLTSFLLEPWVCRVMLNFHILWTTTDDFLPQTEINKVSVDFIGIKTFHDANDTELKSVQKPLKSRKIVSVVLKLEQRFRYETYPVQTGWSRSADKSPRSTSFSPQHRSHIWNQGPQNLRDSTIVSVRKVFWPDDRADTVCTHPAAEAVIQQFSSTDDDEEEEQSKDCERCSCWEESVCTLQTSIHWFQSSAQCESQRNWTGIWSDPLVLQESSGLKFKSGSGCFTSLSRHTLCLFCGLMLL